MSALCQITGVYVISVKKHGNMAEKTAREYEQISLDENSELEDDIFSSYLTKQDISLSESDLNISASESGTDGGDPYLIHDGATSSATSSSRTAGHAGGENRPRCHPAMTSTEAARVEMGSPSSRRQTYSLAGFTGHTYFNSFDSNGSQEDCGTTGTAEKDGRIRRDSNMIEGLLCEIYDRVHVTPYNYKVDSDGFTDFSSNSDGAYLSSKGDSFQESQRLPKAHLNTKDIPELREMVRDLQKGIAIFNGRLVKLLKRRDRNLARQNKNQDVLTAILQAVSQKRRVDARLKFSIEPLPGKKAFRQWYDALRAVARLPQGIPPQFRKKFWLSLANRHVQHLKLDWDKTLRFAFNDRSNPDDDKLGVQIVKDLHRTGCTGFCGTDAEEDRVVLKRVLLAYARWNKSVGYCQGFNVIAALILEVMEHVEDEALKVMIFLIDHVLPDSYFANNLRALSVDMAVFRELLHFKLPDLAQHLDKLQKAANDGVSGNYEPPLTNVFTMQWFLTLFATCLPKPLVLRVWDCIFLEGSEVLLRVALAIWAKLGDKLSEVESSDEFYGRMGAMCNEMLTKGTIGGHELIQTIYSMAPFPFPHLNEIREKYMFSITPFAPLGSLEKSTTESMSPKSINTKPVTQDRPPSDEDVDLDEEDFGALTCFTGLLPMPVSPSRAVTQGDWATKSRAKTTSADITGVSPGAFAASSDTDNQQKPQTAMLERMNLDVYSLKKQYLRIQKRQQTAHVIYGAAGTKEESRGRRLRHHSKTLAVPIDNPAAINHLLIGKHGLGRKNKKTAIVAPQASSSNKSRKHSRSPSTGSPPQSIPSTLPSVAAPGSPDLLSSGGSNGDPDNDSEDCRVVTCGDMIDGVVEGKVYHLDTSSTDSDKGYDDRNNNDKKKQTLKSNNEKPDDEVDSEKDNGTPKKEEVAKEDERSGSGNENEEDTNNASSEGEHTPPEPAIGLLIDLGGEGAFDFLDEHMGSGERERGDGLSPSVEQSMEASPVFSLSSEEQSEDASKHSVSSNQANQSNKSTPEGSVVSLDQITDSADQDTESAVKSERLTSPKRQLNMDISTYTPELSFDGMECMSNPKLDGQSMKKPWQTWDSDDDDDDDFWNDDNDESSPGSSRSESMFSRSTSHTKHSKSKTPPPKPVFNPFPRRKLKSEENRSRTRLKVGLYKTPTKSGQGQNMDHPVQRTVKLGW